MTSLRWMIVVVVLVGLGCDGKANSHANQLKKSENNAGNAPLAERKDEKVDASDSPEESGSAVDSPANSFRPDYAKAILTAESKSFPPIRVLDHWQSEYLIEKSLIRIRGTTVESLNYVTGSRDWNVQSEVGLGLKWLGHHNGTLLFADVRSDKNQSKDEGPPLTGIRRLRLHDGIWLKPLTIPLGDGERTAVNTVSTVLGAANRIMTLSVTLDGEGFFGKRQSYRVTQFEESSADVLWSNVYVSAGTLPAPGAFLFGSLGPARDSASIQGLQSIGSRVLICGGPLEDLLAIEPSDGTTAWKVSRLWEIERGFIGPSVWQHFLGRYGVQEHDLELADLTLEELRAKNETRDGFFASEDYFEGLKKKVETRREQAGQRQGAITAGPVVLDATDDEHGARIYVATAQTMRHDWPAYLSDCVCYEFDDEGKAIGIATLPRFVKGTLHTVVDNSVVWHCEHNAIVRLFPSPNRGTSDHIIDLEWLLDRKKKEDQNKGWFQNGGWTNQIARAGNSFIRVQNGGFVETSESQEYQFCFEIVELLTSKKETIKLRVPFQGRIDPPTNNYSFSPGKDGQTSWVSYTFLPISIIGLEVRGDRFVVVMENQKTRRSLEFDLKAIIAGR